MKVTSLSLRNFRNYDNLKINFSDKVNVFMGKNAQGKTNLLESIFYCCIGKSFKSIKDKDIIKWEKEDGYIGLTAERKYRDVKVEIKLSKTHKKSGFNQFSSYQKDW